MRPRTGGLLRAALRSEPGRTGLAVLGIAVSAFLVMALLAAYRGIAAGVVAYTGQQAVDLWVAPVGTDNLIRSSGLLSGRETQRIRNTTGVRVSGAVLRGFVTAEGENDSAGITLLALAYEAPGGLGGAPAYRAGRPPAGPGEVAMDRAAAWRLGVRVGEDVRLNGAAFRLVGLTSGTNLLATQLAFVDLEAAARWTSYVGQASFLALATDGDPTEVADRIRAGHGKVTVLATPEFVRRNLDEVGAGFRPMQLLVSIIGLAAAVVVVMLLVQALVHDRRSDLAVLLALGSPTTRLAGAVIWHALVTVAAGCLAGAALSYGLATVTARWLPTLELTATAVDVALVSLVLISVSPVGATVPMIRLRRIDPVEAFRP